VKRLLAPILLAALLGAAAASALVVLLEGGTPRSTPAAPATAASVQSGSAGTRREVASTALTASQIYQQDSPGVVSIKAVTSQGEDSGTGIVLNAQGLILTNDHVIAGASSITVGSNGSAKSARAATLVGEEANSDLALIRVDPSGLGLKPLKLVSSTAVSVGDPVYAIGNPYGLNESLTRGIVSALGREISAPDGVKISGAIQTDAALNPGNSGGPLLNDQGEVIGVNSQIASDAANIAGSQPGSTGVGFAIPSNTAARAITAIEAGSGVSAASASRGQDETAEGGYGAHAPSRSSSPQGSPRREREADAGGQGSESRSAGPNGVESAGGSGEGQVLIVP
jgi:putative serine protease PepD